MFTAPKPKKGRSIVDSCWIQETGDKVNCPERLSMRSSFSDFLPRKNHAGATSSPVHWLPSSRPLSVPFLIRTSAKQARLPSSRPPPFPPPFTPPHQPPCPPPHAAPSPGAFLRFPAASNIAVSPGATSALHGPLFGAASKVRAYSYKGTVEALESIS